MEDLQNTSTEGTQTKTEGKTFTQDDVNRIVQERLAKEKGKASGNDEFEKKTAELDKRTTELEARENRLNAVTALRSAGYPDELADVIKCSNADELKSQWKLLTILLKKELRKAGLRNWKGNVHELYRLRHQYIHCQMVTVSGRLWG